MLCGAAAFFFLFSFTLEISWARASLQWAHGCQRLGNGAARGCSASLLGHNFNPPLTGWRRGFVFMLQECDSYMYIVVLDLFFLCFKQRTDENHVDFGDACDELSVLTSWALRVNSACFFFLYFSAVCCPPTHSPAFRTKRYSISKAEAMKCSVSFISTQSCSYRRQRKENIYSIIIIWHVLIFLVVHVRSGDNPFKFTKVLIYSVSLFWMLCTH